MGKEEEEEEEEEAGFIFFTLSRLPSLDWGSIRSSFPPGTKYQAWGRITFGYSTSIESDTVFYLH